MFGVLALSALAAETFTGRLIDSTCYTQQKNADQKMATACDPTGTTTAFGFFVSGTLYKLDDNGNTKASQALKNRADRAADPANPQSTQVMAKITGNKTEDNILAVDSIEVK